MEKERIKKWEADTEKRNAYFRKFGITTITFTDNALKDIAEAFSQVEEYLSAPEVKPAPPPQVTKAIKRYRFE